MNYYSEISKGYNKLHKKEQLEKLNFVKSHINLKDYDTILDVGCGTTISFLTKNTIGIDPSFEMLKKGKGLRVQGFAEKLPFKDNSFDLVTSFTAIQNFKNIDQGLKEIKRVCKKLAVISIIKKSSKLNKIKDLINDNFKSTELDQGVDLVFLCDMQFKL